MNALYGQKKNYISGGFSEEEKNIQVCDMSI